MDAELAALEIEHGATLHTTDRDLRRFSRLRAVELGHDSYADQIGLQGEAVAVEELRNALLSTGERLRGNATRLCFQVLLT